MVTNGITLCVDLDAFYASVEISRNPDLKGKPVVVGPDPRKEKTRGVALTASYEARIFGIQSGMPARTVLERCPDVVFVKSDFKAYAEASERVMRLLRTFSPTGGVFQTSIDEAYIDVTEGCSGFDEANGIAARIQEALESQEGLPCSVGIGPNRMIAKIASKQKKPRGIAAIPPEEVLEFLRPLSVRAIPGIGKKSAAKLSLYGIKTIGDIQMASRETLVKAWGENGLNWLLDRARGVQRPEQQSARRHTIGSERTFPSDLTVTDPMVTQALGKLARGVYDRLRGRTFRTVSIKIRFSDFETRSRARSFKTPQSSPDVLLGSGYQLFDEFLSYKKKLRLVGLRTSNIGPPMKSSSLDTFFNSK